MTRLFFTTLLLAMACTPDEPSLVQDDLSFAAEAATVWDAAPQLHRLQGHRALASDGATAFLIDPRMPAPLDLQLDANTVRGGAWLGDQVLIATPGGIWAWDGRVWSSPLSDAFAQPAESLASDGRALWLRADGGLHRLHNGQLKSITVQNNAPLGPLLLQATVSGTPATWVSVVNGGGSGAMALADDGALLAHLYTDDVRSIGADLSGHAWIADGRELHDLAPNGTWTAWRFDSAVAHVAANPASSALWVKTVDTVYYGTSEGVGPVSGVPNGTWVGADALGRLQVSTAQGVLQVSVDRPAALLDLPTEPIEDRVDVTLEASRWDLLQSVQFSIDDTPTAPVEGPPWTLDIHPSKLTKGAHTVRVKVSYSDGATTELSQPLEVGAGLVTWDDHVRALFEDHCALCHDGASETVLDHPDAWQQRYDDIWNQLETGAMPLGKDPLADEQIELIEAWRDGGFLRTTP